MTRELCKGSSQNLVDMWGGCDERTSWQKAKRYFQAKGYEGRYLLIGRKDQDRFSIWNIEIKSQQKHGLIWNRKVTKYILGGMKT